MYTFFLNNQPWWDVFFLESVYYAISCLLRVMKVGKKLVDGGKNFNFAVSNAGDFHSELEEFGLKFSTTPVVAIRDEKDQKFVMADEFR